MARNKLMVIHICNEDPASITIVIYSIEGRQEGGPGQNPAPNLAPPGLPTPYVALRFW